MSESKETQVPSHAAIKEIERLAVEAGEMNVDQIVDLEKLQSGLPKGIPVIFDKKQQKAFSLKALIEEWRVKPAARKGTAQVSTLASLIDLTKRHASPATSVLFARTSWPKPHILAVIDYHSTDHEPENGQHCVHYNFPITPEFEAWISQNGKSMEQGEFAQFLEDHAAELSSPQDGERSEYERLFKERFATPADLITLSRSLEVCVGQKVARSERLQTGERTILFEETQTTAKGEAIDVPGIFMIAVPAFMDGEPVRLPARLRYRVAQGTIHWSYHLYRWETWLREQVTADLDKAAKETGLPAYEGAPETSTGSSR